MLCKFGCGQEVQYKDRCSKSANTCPINRKKNSLKIKEAHSSGKNIGWSSVKNLNRKGKLGKLEATEDYFKVYDKTKKHTYAIKKKLVSELGHKCQKCNLTHWLEKPITLELEHINGDGRDNRRVNLQLLCPNCHSQTPTWRRKKHASVVE